MTLYRASSMVAVKKCFDELSMDAAFPLCVTTDNLWRKKDVSFGSPLEVVIRLPMADIRSMERRCRRLLRPTRALFPISRVRLLGRRVAFSCVLKGRMVPLLKEHLRLRGICEGYRLSSGVWSFSLQPCGMRVHASRSGQPFCHMAKRLTYYQLTYYQLTFLRIAWMCLQSLSRDWSISRSSKVYFLRLSRRHRLHHCWRNPVLIRSCIRVIVQSPISTLFQRYWKSYSWPGSSHSPNFCRMQSAYRKDHSTETALLYIYNDIFKSMENRRGTVLVSLDLSAAFNMVDHDKLIQRLSDYFELTGVAVTWVQSYLSNREQFIKIRDHSSRATRMESGIPQGSVLEPFHFSTYVSPLSKIIPDTVKFHQYVDDTQLYCSISTSEFASEVSRLQDCVRDVSDWFLTNCMQLNGDKSKARLVALGAQAAKVDPKATVDIAGSAMELSADIRSLGVHMDGQLNMDRHVNSVCSSCYYHIRALRHIRPSLNQETAANIGRSVVSSRLDYCNSLMNRISRANMKKLQRVQNALIRVICSLGPRDSVSKARRDLHWALAPDRTADHFQDRCTHIQLSPEVGSSVSVWSSSRLSATSNVEIRRRGDPWGTKN